MNDEYVQDKRGKILTEFKYKSVIGIWGNKKAYIVHDLNFDKSPMTQFFIDHNGKKISIAEYFSNTYGLKVKARK